MRKLVHAIDLMSEWTGRTGRWFGVILVAIVTFGVITRYVFHKPFLWTYEVSVMLGASLFVLAFAYTHLHKAHVRVDLIYSHLSPRGQAIIDVLGNIFLFFPFIILLTITAWELAFSAWATGERMPITGWYPPAGPLRTIVFIGMLLFGLQGLANFIRDVYAIIRGVPYD
jgi:TRAP-type mannitol/chloroaromatic compound transport system permease small subunit